MIEIILAIVVCISLILLVVTIIDMKFQMASTKMDKAEEDIDRYLVEKKELLDRSRPIIQEELKLDHFLTELDQNTGDLCIPKGAIKGMVTTTNFVTLSQMWVTPHFSSVTSFYFHMNNIPSYPIRKHVRMKVRW